MPSRERVGRRERRRETEAQSQVSESAHASSSGRPVDAKVREVLEPTFSHSFANVRVHDGATAHAMTADANASAMTVGRDIFFAPGAYEPDTPAGVHRLAHELAHTVQQSRQESGAGSRTPNELLPVDTTREGEARSAADAALAGWSFPLSLGGDAGAYALEESGSKETEAQKAQQIVGQFPFMRQFFPDWAFTAQGGAFTATKSDGTTALSRSASGGLDGGAHGEIAQRRITETDKDHAMMSEYKGGFGDGAGFLEWMNGGKFLNANGEKTADETRQRLTIGPNTIGGRSEVTRTNDLVTTNRTSQMSYKDGETTASIDAGRTFALDDNNQLYRKGGAEVGTTGAKAWYESGGKVKDIDTNAVEGSSRKMGAGYDAKTGFNASYATNKSTTIDNQTFSSGNNFGASSSGVTYQRTKEQSATDADGNKTSNTKATGVGVDWNGNVSLSQSRTDAHGNQTSVSLGGNLDPSNLSINAGISRNGKSVSVHGGYEVHADDPVKSGDKWVVNWERKLTAGAGGKAKGVGANASHEDAQFGSKAFKSEAEAKAFASNAASALPSASQDPTTVEGAMYLDIGESRGRREANTVGASVDVSPTAGSISGGASSRSSSGMQVQRISPTVFELSYSSGDSDTLQGGASTLGSGASAHKTTSSSQSHTVQVDISTEEGKKAFETFSKNKGELSPGAKLISESTSKGVDKGQTVSMPGFTHDRSGYTSETVTNDKQGKTETYVGGTRENVKSKFHWMGGDQDQYLQLEAKEYNDKKSSYAIHGGVLAEDGHDSFQQLANMTGTVTRDASQAKSSGKWGVDVELTEAMVDQFTAGIAKEREREVGIFEGDDARNNLRIALHDAKSSDDKKRAITQYFADFGQDGKAFEAMRTEIFGSRPDEIASFGNYDQMKRAKGANFDYDLTLPNDRNFGGIAQRKQLESNISQFEKAMAANPAAAGSLHGSIDEQLKEVQRQRSEIADPKRYTDLPDELRENQLTRLDQYISRLTGLVEDSGAAFTDQDATRAAAESAELDAASKPGKGGKAGGALHASENDPGAQLRHLRSEIGINDRMLREARREYQKAYEEFQEAKKAAIRSLPHTRVQTPSQKAVADASAEGTAAMRLQEQAKALDAGVQQARSAFIEGLGNPDSATALATTALSQVSQCQDLWSKAQFAMLNATVSMREATNE